MKRLLAIVTVLAGSLLTGCSTTGSQIECPTCQPCPPTSPGTQTKPQTPPTTPTAKPMHRVNWEEVSGWESDELTLAWPAFLKSCEAFSSRNQWALWRNACEIAKGMSQPDSTQIRKFFELHFEPYLLTNPDGTTHGMVTGYYEPLLKGSRLQTRQYNQPVLGVPEDLLTIDLSSVLPELKNMRLRGRLEGNKVVPYYSRAQIVEAEKEKMFPANVLLWVDDAVELFFLQIQGSGRVQLPDGEMVRIGYADQNGHPYQSVGRVLIDRGELRPEQASMQGIQAWARANPARLDELLNTNPSFVFFRELTTAKQDEGPIGALGIPLTPERSIAIDPRHTPLGAPVFLSTTQPNSKTKLERLVMAQDTGGAIRGVVRADYFWGFGAEAGALAGRMKQQGQMWALLPKGSVNVFNK